MDGVLAMKRSTDGGMEMSFVPQGRSRSGPGEWGSDDGLAPRGGRPERSKVERFGAGMEKDQEEEKGRDRGGRTKRRDVGRSASKNTFRRR